MDIRACLYLQGYVSEGIVEYSCSGMLQDVAGCSRKYVVGRVVEYGGHTLFDLSSTKSWRRKQSQISNRSQSSVVENVSSIAPFPPRPAPFAGLLVCSVCSRGYGRSRCRLSCFGEAIVTCVINACFNHHSAGGCCGSRVSDDDHDRASHLTLEKACACIDHPLCGHGGRPHDAGRCHCGCRGPAPGRCQGPQDESHRLRTHERGEGRAL